MAADSRRKRPKFQRTRYFADLGDGSIPEARVAHSSAPASLSKRICFICFGEGHDSVGCPNSAIACSVCGSNGHVGDDCPVYLMELSLRGSLRAYIQQQCEQEQRPADKGRFPAQDPQCSQSIDQSNDGISIKSIKKSNKAAKRLALSSIQCVVCGELGHANCREPPASQGALYCPSCSNTGHRVTDCPRRTACRQQGISGDIWAEAAAAWATRKDERGISRARGAESLKPKPRWQKHRAAFIAKAAAADPWHPSHLR
ncbi:DNA-binding protein HEXBP-like [Cyclospora cayetanensis]|uniref:DNA-binding protein HEXBP-like n=1 Tax=Cyclospora cayetanensis TaxID=88456 RepID=A0A6P6RYF2_9EIME|nr:DNA-binding protein HEXBP-like [Cyclospora cayetanensis]